MMYIEVTIRLYMFFKFLNKCIEYIRSIILRVIREYYNNSPGKIIYRYDFSTKWKDMKQMIVNLFGLYHPRALSVWRWNLDRITVFASWIFENFGSALFFSLTYENMTVSLGRIRKYSLVPYLDRCPEEFHGTNGYYKVFQTISLIF